MLEDLFKADLMKQIATCDDQLDRLERDIAVTTRKRQLVWEERVQLGTIADLLMGRCHDRDCDECDLRTLCSRFD